MNDKSNVVNMEAAASATVAPIQNVFLAVRVLEQAMNRPAHLPGMVCFSGPSGWGKSTAAAYAANKHRAYYVECKSTWTKGDIPLAILREMGIHPAKRITPMIDQVCEQLAKSGRPMIVDEMDHIVEKKAVEVIRDIYEGSNAAIMLIGEEHIDTKLQRWERFHNRMLAWELAQPADIQDTQHLAKLYVKKVNIKKDLLEYIRQQSGCIARRICVNLNLVEQEALNQGLDSIDRKTWGDRPLYTGQAPRR